MSDFTCVFELRVDSPGGYGHDNGEHGPYFFIAKPLFLGHAKVLLHSRIAADGHCGSHVQHQGGFWL